MKRVKLPEPVLPNDTWVRLFFSILGAVFSEVTVRHGYSEDAVQVWRLRPMMLCVRDPHGLLQKADFRASVSETIGRYADPTVARYVRFIVLGGLD